MTLEQQNFLRPLRTSSRSLKLRTSKQNPKLSVETWRIIRLYRSIIQQNWESASEHQLSSQSSGSCVHYEFKKQGNLRKRRQCAAFLCLVRKEDHVDPDRKRWKDQDRTKQNSGSRGVILSCGYILFLFENQGVAEECSILFGSFSDVFWTGMQIVFQIKCL